MGLALPQQLYYAVPPILSFNSYTYIFLVSPQGKLARFIHRTTLKTVPK